MENVVADTANPLPVFSRPDAASSYAARIGATRIGTCEPWGHRRPRPEQFPLTVFWRANNFYRKLIPLGNVKDILRRAIWRGNIGCQAAGGAGQAATMVYFLQEIRNTERQPVLQPPRMC